MDIFALRLRPGDDLKENLQNFVQQNQLQAGFILTTVGSLTQATLRFAGRSDTETLTGKFEIVSLVGTLSVQGVHLHLSISDENGTTIGGHVSQGCLINTTAEIVIGSSSQHIFSRRLDDQTGYHELEITTL